MKKQTDSSRWLERDMHGVTRKEKLYFRQKMLQVIRRYFQSEDFLEAEIPLLVEGTTPDPFIQSFATEGKYLTTSTEYQIKRMIAGGFERVYTLTKNFRKNDADETHNPEFTMLEWARAGVSFQQIEQDVIRMIVMLFRELFPNQAQLEYQGNRIDLNEDCWERMTFQELFQQQYGILIPEDFDLSRMNEYVSAAGMEIEPFFQQNPDLLLSELLDRAIKRIGFSSPVFLKKWPSIMTSSAECTSSEVKWTERAELIIAGLEVADGFPFLCDDRLQISFFERANSIRRREGYPTVEYDRCYLEMLQFGLPKGAGMALGIDRLTMLFTNSCDIKEVLCFSWDEL